ncbi:hypothetical protein [Cohnella algarum]|uniref:hypothetical protein n=1 Tax=Cohnella algarum TaxID=2044859 RepID=UPI0019679446|nr:hypothetical protein [Cohnella algarum]MBN2982775.1 hypothetical protein [Cohnella algarum]
MQRFEQRVRKHVRGMTRHEYFAASLLGKYGPLARRSVGPANLTFRMAARPKRKKTEERPVIRVRIQPLAQPATREKAVEVRERVVERDRVVERTIVREKERIVENVRIVNRNVFVIREADRMIREQRLLREFAMRSPVGEKGDVAEEAVYLADMRDEPFRSGLGVEAGTVTRKKAEKGGASQGSREPRGGPAPRGRPALGRPTPQEGRAPGESRPSSDGRAFAPNGQLSPTGSRTAKHDPSSGSGPKSEAERAMPAARAFEAGRERRGGKALSEFAGALFRKAAWPLLARKKPGALARRGEDSLRPADGIEPSASAEGPVKLRKALLKRAIFDGPLEVRRTTGRMPADDRPDSAGRRGRSGFIRILRRIPRRNRYGPADVGRLRRRTRRLRLHRQHFRRRHRLRLGFRPGTHRRRCRRRLKRRPRRLRNRGSRERNRMLPGGRDPFRRNGRAAPSEMPGSKRRPAEARRKREQRTVRKPATDPEKERERRETKETRPMAGTRRKGWGIRRIRKVFFQHPRKTGARANAVGRPATRVPASPKRKPPKDGSPRREATKGLKLKAGRVRAPDLSFIRDPGS